MEKIVITRFGGAWMLLIVVVSFVGCASGQPVATEGGEAGMQIWSSTRTVNGAEELAFAVARRNGDFRAGRSVVVTAVLVPGDVTYRCALVAISEAALAYDSLEVGIDGSAESVPVAALAATQVGAVWRTEAITPVTRDALERLALARAVTLRFTGESQPWEVDVSDVFPTVATELIAAVDEWSSTGEVPASLSLRYLGIPEPR